MPQMPNAALWKQLFRRCARENMNLQGQIREMLVSAILDGQLAPGAPVPSSREMADQLGVARNTVVLAYQQLADEGYLVSRQRSGHFVNGDVLTGRVAGPSRASAPRADSGARVTGASSEGASPADARRGQPDWARRLRERISAQRSIVKPADWQAYPYPFLYGQFDSTLFPMAAWRECCIKTLSVLDTRDWAPDQIARDDEALVQQ
ncbi:MAG: GntR family transcriptional regulator, partial [Burkholderiaceae bacterium]|nr:GntR family transcriptional regulator [Burkholderiaceae bacterium]